MFWCFLSQQLLKCELAKNARFVIHDFHPSILRRAFFKLGCCLIFGQFSLVICSKKKTRWRSMQWIIFYSFFCNTLKVRMQMRAWSNHFRKRAFYVCTTFYTLTSTSKVGIFSHWASHASIQHTCWGLNLSPCCKPTISFPKYEGLQLLNRVWGPNNVYM